MKRVANIQHANVMKGLVSSKKEQFLLSYRVASNIYILDSLLSTRRRPCPFVCHNNALCQQSKLRNLAASCSVYYAMQYLPSFRMFGFLADVRVGDVSSTWLVELPGSVAFFLITCNERREDLVHRKSMSGKATRSSADYFPTEIWEFK
jgi:hypothetical protein